MDQNYVRPDTHAVADARLVDYQSRIGITDLWGGGLVASVDGLRSRVPARQRHQLIQDRRPLPPRPPVVAALHLLFVTTLRALKCNPIREATQPGTLR